MVENTRGMEYSHITRIINECEPKERETWDIIRM
jgi:hypothetical protein